MKDVEKKQGLLELSAEQLADVAGGMIVEDGNGEKYWLVRENGTVISPVPSREKAIDFAKAYHLSTRILTTEEYKQYFGRELKW